MKAIIPVAGAGTKLRPHTYTQPKALIPLAGKTVLSVIIDQVREAGIQECIFIIGYLGDKIQDYVTQTYPDLKCSFVTQNERTGTGPAILLTKEFVGDDEVLIVLGDTIADYDLKEVLNSPFSMLGVKKVDDPRNFGVAEIKDDNTVTRVVEKPAIPKSNMALVGVYKIKETQILYQCLENIVATNQKKYDEFSITDALECMIGSGAKFKAFKVENWYDCGKKSSIIESNAILLKKFGSTMPEPSAVVNSIIIPPVSFGKDCVVKDSVIGPNVTVGDHTIIQRAIINDSIIGSFSNIYKIILENSLIGSDAEVKGTGRNLNIGDNTAVDLSGGQN
jgi:glucose-1-phosphate thymidylyltransferase